jgi:hypothetical protein
MICFCSNEFVLKKSILFPSYGGDLYICECGIELYMGFNKKPYAYYKGVGNEHYLAYIVESNILTIESFPVSIDRKVYIIKIPNKDFLLNILNKKDFSKIFRLLQ